MMAKNGRAGPALATAAIGSFVAGTIATVIVLAVRAVGGRVGAEIRPGRLLRLMVLAFTTVSAVLGPSALRGLRGLFLGLFIGLIGTDAQTGPDALQPGHPRALRRHRRRRRRGGPLRGGRDAVHRQPPAARQIETVEKIKGSIWMSGVGLEALVAGVAARHRVRLSVRRDAGRRRRDPDLPVLRDREEAVAAQGGIRQRARSRASPDRRRRTTRRDHGAGPAADAGPADLGHRRDHPAGFQQYGHPARSAAVHDAARPGLGPDRQPVHRQRHAAGAEPAAGRHLGEPAGDPAPATSTPAS